MPVTDAICISGVNWYWEAPSKFQGKPENSRPTIISSATQDAAPRMGYRMWDMGYGVWDPDFHLPSSIFHGRVEGWLVETIHTQVAGKSAKYALSATQPAPGPSGIPCQR